MSSLKLDKMKTQRLFIVDDHELFREGIKLMLEKFDHIEVVGEAETAEEFLSCIDSMDVDIVLLDIDLPGIGGEEACRTASIKQAGLKVIAVSNFSDEAYYYRMLDAGARGYVAKQLSVGELLSAIEHVANGEYYFSDRILKEILLRQPEMVVLESSAKKKKSVVLSDQEQRILNYIARGNSESEIANFLGITLDNVARSVSSLMDKTGAEDYVQLIIYSIAQNEIDVGLN